MQNNQTPESAYGPGRSPSDDPDSLLQRNSMLSNVGGSFSARDGLPRNASVPSQATTGEAKDQGDENIARPHSPALPTMLATGSCENLYSEPVSDFNNALPLGKAHTMQEPSAELHKAQESLRAYEAICKDLQQRLSDMENDLRDARDVIFRLQPSHHHITRNEAQFQYDALCEGVGSWINFHFEDTFNDNSAARGNFNRKSAEILVGWMTPSSRSSRKVLDTDEYHIISAVMNFLLQEILGKDFYGAAQDGALEFLQALERSMSCLEPRRGFSTCRAWRSETFLSLANSPDFDKRQAIRSQELATQLVLTLQVLLPQSTKKDLEREKESLHNSIIRPAIKLAESIQMSPEKFTLAFSDFAYALNPNDRGDPPGILEGIHKLDCLNILQGGKALSSSALQDSGARGNTTYLLDIYPGLYCQTLNGDVPSDIKVLKKPKVLVAMVRPGQGSNHVHEGSTLMDFIYDQVYP